MSKKNLLVIGVCGQPSSGKDTIANYLVSRGFKHISTGDILREEMKQKGVPVDRLHMHDFVIAERKKRGGGYLAEEAASRIRGNTIISGLRNTSEVKFLKASFGNQFVLLSIEAPIEMRYKRVQNRNRTGDNISFEQFKEQEETERQGNPESHEVDAVISMADYKIDNSSTEEELFMKIDSFLFKELKQNK